MRKALAGARYLAMIKSSSGFQLVEDKVGILKPAKIIFGRESTTDIHFTGDYSFDTNLPSKMALAFQPLQAQAEAYGYQKMSVDRNSV